MIVARNERGETCDVAGRRESPPRRHPRRVDRSRARRRRCSPTRARDIANRVAAALDYRGVLCVEMFVSRRRRAARQRDRAAPAQQRPLHDRRVRHVAVRAAGARARGPAARRHAPAHAGRDGEPAGRPVVRRRRATTPREPAWARRAAPSGGQAASLRQGRAAARPQDGARHLPRRRRSTAALATARAIKRSARDSGRERNLRDARRSV